MPRSRRHRSHVPLTFVISGLSRIVFLLLLILLLAKQAVSTVVPIDNWAPELAKLPSCAKSCLAESCDLSNITCICEMEAESLNDVKVLAACTVPEALFTNNITKTTCQVPVRDRALQFNIMMTILGTAAAIIVTIRLVFKQYWSARLRLETDDLIILSAIPIGISTIVFTMTGLTANGLGTDLWGVNQSKLKTFGVYFYAIQILYIILMAQLKLSLCFFYLNIFTGKLIRQLLWGTVIFHILFSTAFVFAAIFQCRPISFHWDKFDFSNGPLQGAYCFNVNAAGWANAAITVSSDFWLIAIPLSQVIRLKLHWKKKIGVFLMFLTGAIVTIVSFLRLRSIVRFASTANPTWDLWGIVWWSSIELTVGFICTCLPSMRLLLLRVAPHVFGSEYHSLRPQPIPLLPRRPQPPLCSGHTLTSLRPSYKPNSQNQLDETHSHQS